MYTDRTMTTPISPKSKRIPRFVEEYVKDSNASRAALEAGWPPSWAHTAGWKLLQMPEVQALIDEQRTKISKVAEVDAAFVLQQWLLLAAADPAKISKVRQINCRHCWGIDHKYQWKAHEYAAACERAAKAVDKKGNPCPEPPPDCSGGFGFVRPADPNPDCPHCDGEGVEDIVFNDMSSLGPAERKLIASVEKTKDGLKVKMRDQDAAVRNLCEYLGMIVKRQELTGKDGAPLVPPPELPADPALMQQLYAQLTKGS